MVVHTQWLSLPSIILEIKNADRRIKHQAVYLKVCGLRLNSLVVLFEEIRFAREWEGFSRRNDAWVI